uniref:ATP synthase F0 subunit 8 n=1 Tax=Strahlaxius plectrorhynchus TaxID=2302681 RepID=A0A4Y5QM11_9EUCA|nr:ATP synthase F0 subunit 8 [Strahlaxius plectrorhynchus]QCX31781.1 ATP synthase F0 subunit 8 [Strahlaxius plectrorhynchus]
MPQMAPLMWLNLMCMFLGVFIMFFCLTYFMSVPLPSVNPTKDSEVMNKSWKW